MSPLSEATSVTQFEKLNGLSVVLINLSSRPSQDPIKIESKTKHPFPSVIATI